MVHQHLERDMQAYSPNRTADINHSARNQGLVSGLVTGLYCVLFEEIAQRLVFILSRLSLQVDATLLAQTAPQRFY